MVSGKEKNKKGKIVGALLGTLMEYYDYSLYGFSAGIIGTKFFPEADILKSLEYVFAIYAISYFTKPFGSLLFGWIGDRYGRKKALSFTVVGIVVPTLVIGLLPEYSSIGVKAIIILLICRFAQSVFIAGEYDGAAVYVIEHLGKKYPYLASGLTRAMGAAGVLLGVGSVNFFGSGIFPQWGWRIPFLVSLPLAAVTLYYRNRLEETPDFLESEKSGIEAGKLFALLKKRFPMFLGLVFLAGGFGATYQISVIFMKQYLPIVAPQTSTVISTLSILLVFLFGLSMPIAGILADRFGLSFIFAISCLFAIFSCLSLGIGIKYGFLNLVIGSSLSLAISVAPFNGLAHAAAVKFFDVKERYRLVSLGHTTGSLLMSGSAAYICVYFMKSFDLKLFPLYYVAFFSIVTYSVIRILEKKFDRKL